MPDARRLTLPATLDSLGSVRAFAREAAEQVGVDPRRTYGLQIALDEIATNVVTHGYGASGTEGTLELRAEVVGDTLVVTLEDRGPAFDPRERPLPSEEELARPLEEREAGGLGIYLALEEVDRFDYRRVGDRNENVFEVRIGAEP